MRVRGALHLMLMIRRRAMPPLDAFLMPLPD